jgi:hypothetical protein
MNYLTSWVTTSCSMALVVIKHVTQHELANPKFLSACEKCRNHRLYLTLFLAFLQLISPHCTDISLTISPEGMWSVLGPACPTNLLTRRMFANVPRAITASFPLREPYELNSRGVNLNRKQLSEVLYKALYNLLKRTRIFSCLDQMVTNNLIVLYAKTQEMMADLCIILQVLFFSITVNPQPAWRIHPLKAACLVNMHWMNLMDSMVGLNIYSVTYAEQNKSNWSNLHTWSSSPQPSHYTDWATSSPILSTSFMWNGQQCVKIWFLYN